MDSPQLFCDKECEVELPNAINQDFFNSLEDVNQHIVPIMKMTGKKLRVVGTAVCIEHEKSWFLATANHVVSDDRSSLYIPWVSGKILTVKVFRSIHIDHEVVDVSVFLLPEGSYDFKPVTALTNSSRVGAEMLLAGFPASRSTSFNNMIRYEARFLKTWAIANSGRFPLFDEKVNFVCDFHQRNILLGGGERGRFADPWGMSGGAAFEIQHENGKYSYSLAGIITDWDHQKRQFMKCTKVLVIHDLMNKLLENPS